MEWLFLLAFLFWDKIAALLGWTKKDDSECDDDPDWNEDDDVVEENKPKAVAKKNVTIKENVRTEPTVTRVSGANLKDKLINRPTVIKRKK